MAEHASRACIILKTYAVWPVPRTNVDDQKKKHKITEICPMAINEAATNAFGFSENWSDKKSNRVDGNILPQI